MTTQEFNDKYGGYLEEGHYGLDISNSEFITWLDGKFQSFVQKPGFKYSQIKEKFGMGRFYCEGLDREEVDEVEAKISQMNGIGV